MPLDEDKYKTIYKNATGDAGLTVEHFDGLLKQLSVLKSEDPDGNLKAIDAVIEKATAMKKNFVASAGGVIPDLATMQERVVGDGTVDRDVQTLEDITREQQTAGGISAGEWPTGSADNRPANTGALLPGVEGQGGEVLPGISKSNTSKYLVFQAS